MWKYTIIVSYDNIRVWVHIIRDLYEQTLKFVYEKLLFLARMSTLHDLSMKIKVIVILKTLNHM